MMRRILAMGLVVVWASTASAQYTKPNGSPSTPDAQQPQSEIFQSDYDALTAGVGGTGVLYGGAVAPQTSPNMTVKVAAGAVQIAGVPYAVANTGTLNISAAHSLYDRLDLVTVTSSGTPTVTAGTASDTPSKPAIPAGAVLLAEVYVPKGATAITAARIVDNRFFVAPNGGVNVLAFGAVPDSSTNSTTAIQSAITAAQAGSGRPVFFPAGPGCYRISAPLVVIGENPIRLFGDWRALDKGSCILNDLTYAPIFYVAGTTPQTPQTYVSALVGTGSALVAAGGDHTFTDWADAGAPTRINGLSQFNLRGLIKTTNLASGPFYQYVCDSSGTITTSSARTSAFYVRLSNDGRIRAALNVGGSTTEIFSGTGVVVDGVVRQFELDYDGSNVRFFTGTPGGTSTLVGTVAVSGTVQQGDFEMMGCATGTRVRFPHGPPAESNFTGAIDSVQLSSVSRHTSTYTVPSTKYTADGQTLILQNFDNESDRFSVARTGASNVVYLPKMGNGYTQVAHAEIDHLSLRGQGAAAISMVGVIDSSFHDLNFYGGMQYGIDCSSDCYLDRVERISSLYVRFPISFASQTGITNICNVTATGATVPIIWGYGGGTLCNIYNTGGSTVWGAVLRSGTYSMAGGGVSTEDASGAVFKGALYLDDLQGSTFTGIGLESIQNDVPLVTVHGGQGIVFTGSRFNSKSTTTKIFDIESAMSTPLYVINPMKDQAGVPWATDAGVRVLPESAKGAPTKTSGFGTSPTIAGSTKSFTITIGSGGTDSSGVLAMPNPPAPTGWNCVINNVTKAAAHAATNTRQTVANSTTSVTFEQQTTSTGAAIAWGVGDVLVGGCEPY